MHLWFISGFLTLVIIFAFFYVREHLAEAGEHLKTNTMDDELIQAVRWVIRARDAFSAESSHRNEVVYCGAWTKLRELLAAYDAREEVRAKCD